MSFAVLFALCISGHAQSGPKCEASVNGYKIHTVFIVGDQYNGVAWAYKNLSDWTCLTPTTDISKADAILEVRPIAGTSQSVPSEPLTVSCFSHGTSSTCTDSDGNDLTVDCSGGTCTSYYGPNLGMAVGHAIRQWIETRWYQSKSRLWTVDHKLLWQEEDQKGGSWLDQWQDKLRNGTNSPPCKLAASGSMDRHRYKTYREWASYKCGVEFAPRTSIDLVVSEREVKAAADKSAKDQMVQNAHEAAAKQSASQ